MSVCENINTRYGLWKREFGNPPMNLPDDVDEKSTLLLVLKKVALRSI